MHTYTNEHLMSVSQSYSQLLAAAIFGKTGVILLTLFPYRMQEKNYSYSQVSFSFPSLISRQDSNNFLLPNLCTQS